MIHYTLTTTPGIAKFGLDYCTAWQLWTRPLSQLEDHPIIRHNLTTRSITASMMEIWKDTRHEDPSSEPILIAISMADFFQDPTNRKIKARFDFFRGRQNEQS